MVKQAIIGFSAALVLALGGCSEGGGPTAPPPPVVTVSHPLVSDIVDWDDYVGQFEAVQNVEVRPRATGYLSAVHFKDGQNVTKGQLLFTVDPRPAQADVAQAQAQLAQAQANYANAKTELARTQTLVAARAASQEELESRQASVRTGAAQVEAARAVLRARQLDLGFTSVTAPISGRISERKVDPGNTVTKDQTILTTIVSTDPLHFNFQGSEALLLKYQRGGAGAVQGTPVRIRLADESDYTHPGKLDFVDNAIAQGSGTIKVRAIVPNPGGFIKPGMFGNLRLEASRAYPAMLVPAGAIVADASRRIVYVLGKDNTVEARPVELGPLTGNLRVIRSGLSQKDVVVISGAQRARPGLKVAPRQGRIVREKAPPVSQNNEAAAASIALPAGEQ